MKLGISLLLFVLFAAFSVSVKNQLRKETSPLEALALGSLMPSFTLEDTHGNSVKFEAGPQTNKLTLINFWATWCGPCRMEMPSFERIYSAKQKEGFLILAVNEDEKRSELDTYLAKKPVTFPILLDPEGKVEKQLKIRAFPTSILVDAEGKILKVTEGLEPYLQFVIEGFLGTGDSHSG
ncbi:MAG: TlpA disulfide reductase family protein, partial [Opitutaceae bacterium]